VFRRIKKLLPTRIKKAALSFFSREEIELPLGNRAFIFLAADYGNIGDLAISAAQALFLAKYANFPHVVRIPISRTNALLRSVKSQINPGDLITIVGGGNMGSLYPDIEKLRQLVIRTFPKNRIVCFPQTLDWADSVESDRTLTRIVRVYSQHPNLHVFARESVTQRKLDALFRSHSSVHIGYAPDIVLSATASELGSVVDAAPAGILLCLRDDRECALDSAQRSELQTALAHTGHHLEMTDTHAGGSGLSEALCAQLVGEKVNQFGAAKLVVTDRLHGMILSVIAGTPCLVLPNSNHKIRQTWKDWLGDAPQVRFLAPGDMTELPELLSELLAVPRRELGRAPVAYRHYEGLTQATVHS